MTRFALAAALLCGLALPAAAQQTSLLTASPIPDGAETRFCYYGGLAYSRHAYILIGGENSVTNLSGGGVGATVATGVGPASGMSGGGQIRSVSEAKPLQCVVGDDGVLGWSAVATVQIGR